MSLIKKSYHAISSTYDDTTKNIFAISEIVCTFAAFKLIVRYNAADKSCQPFLYLDFTNKQANGFVVCGSSNARKDEHYSPEQHHKPYFFNVQNYSAMNDNRRTAGETAMMGATYAERKEYMQKCLAESSTAILVYFDENCQIKTYGIAERGFESALLPMLEQASEKARRVAEEVML
jgi:PKD repeat protein